MKNSFWGGAINFRILLEQCKDESDSEYLPFFKVLHIVTLPSGAPGDFVTAFSVIGLN